MTNVFWQTKIDTSSEIDIISKSGIFSNPGSFSIQPATHYSSLKFDAEYEF